MSTTWWSETRFREVGGLSLSCHRTWEFTILIPSPIAIDTRIITLIPSNFEICGCICVKILFEQMQNKLREIMANPSLCKPFTDQISQNSGCASHPSKFQVSQGSIEKKLVWKWVHVFSISFLIKMATSGHGIITSTIHCFNHPVRHLLTTTFPMLIPTWGKWIH